MGADLSTKYLGLDLDCAIIAAATPLSGRLRCLQALQDAGAGAVVMQSLFAEQIDHENLELLKRIDVDACLIGEAASYFDELEDYNAGPRSYLDHLERTCRTLEIPVIGSLNASEPGGWIRHASLIEEAGAAALELNVYDVAADPGVTGAEVERRYVELVQAVCEAVSIPVAVKIGPAFSSVASMARRLAAAGAKGLVLFNRFVHPDIDLERLQVIPDLSLSRRDELKQTLRWIAILRGRTPASLGATGGVHQAEDVLKLLLAGADVVMMASSLLKRGPAWLGTVREQVAGWIEDRELQSVETIKGMLCQLSVDDPSAYERTQYMKALVGFSKSFARADPSS